MSKQNIQPTYVSLGEKNSLRWVKILVYQFSTDLEQDWEKHKSEALYYPKRVDKFKM